MALSDPKIWDSYLKHYKRYALAMIIIDLRPEAKVTVTKKQYVTLFYPKCIRKPNLWFLFRRYAPDTIILEPRQGVNLILCSNVDQDTYGKLTET